MRHKPLLNSADETSACFLINTKMSNSQNIPKRKGLILKLIDTFVRVTTEGRTGVQVDATVCVQRDHRTEATVYGHNAAVTVAVAAPAAVVVMDHHHLSGGSCWKTQKKRRKHYFYFQTFENVALSL